MMMMMFSEMSRFQILPLPPTHFVSQPEARGQERVQNVVIGDQTGARISSLIVLLSNMVA